MAYDSRRVNAGDRKIPSEPYNLYTQAEADAENAKRGHARGDALVTVPDIVVPSPGPGPVLPDPAPEPAPPVPVPAPLPPSLEALAKAVDDAHTAYLNAVAKHDQSASQEAADRSALVAAALAVHVAIQASVTAELADDPTTTAPVPPAV